MVYLEIAVAFLIGLALMLLLGWVFSLKTKGLSRILINAVAGLTALLLLALLKVANAPINPLNALIVGFLGVPGIIVIFIIALFL